MNKNILLLGVATISILTLAFTGATYLSSLDTAKSAPLVTDLETIDSSDLLAKDTYFNSLPTETLSQVEKDGLLQMREEEKLAHDVYTFLYEKWGQNIFNNISDSEQTHTDMVKALLEKYGISDPSIDKGVGEFSNEEMTNLYNSLTTQGSKSLTDALTVGALIEDLDISDLQKLIKTVDNQDILTVYNNLEKGSRNHIRSFTRLLNRNGSTYQPQYISEIEYNSIIASASENGTTLDSKGNKR